MRKYPECTICSRIKEEYPEVTDEQLNNYHEGIIGVEDFPEEWQDKIIEILKEHDGEVW